MEGAPTQYRFMNQYASVNNTVAAMNGLTFVPVAATNPSPTTPLAIATREFSVVIMLNIALRLILLRSKPRLWYSVTIQLSKALYMSVVLKPPRTRPTNKMSTSSEIWFLSCW